MSVSCQHNDCIGKGKKLVSISIVFLVGFKISDREFPNNSLYLLCLAWEPELGKQLSDGFIVLNFFEFEKFAVRVENFQNFGVILTEVIAQ